MKILPPIGDEDKMLSGLCYPLWPIAPPFILLSTKRKDPFLHFHAIQGLGFGIAASFLVLLLGLGVWVIFQILPVDSTLLGGFLGVSLFAGGIVGLTAIFLSSLFLGWRASAGELLRLPVLGEWAEARVVVETGADLQDFDPFLPLRTRDENTDANLEKQEPFGPGTAPGPFGARRETALSAQPTAKPPTAFPSPPTRQAGPFPTQGSRDSAKDGSGTAKGDQFRTAFGSPRPLSSGPTGPQQPRPETGLLRQWLAANEEED